MKQKITYLFLLGVLLLTACGNSNADVTPTSELSVIQTQAAETISAFLTQTALVAPTQTPPSTPTLFPTFEPVETGVVATLPAATQPAAASPTASCYQLRFVSDVTIPDNTQVAPGQSFTKTWKVANTGTCAWDAGFKFVFVGGEAMSGVTYTLPASVAVNAQYDISVPMVAPTDKTGSLRGNWRMQTAGGTYFGDEVYVLINVGGGTLTPTSTSVPPTATTQPSYP